MVFVLRHLYIHIHTQTHHIIIIIHTHTPVHPHWRTSFIWCVNCPHMTLLANLFSGQFKLCKMWLIIYSSGWSLQYFTKCLQNEHKEKELIIKHQWKFYIIYIWSINCDTKALTELILAKMRNNIFKIHILEWKS